MSKVTKWRRGFTVSLVRVRDLLEYDPITGIFLWKVSRPNGVKAGDRAGSVQPPHGYRQMMVDGQAIYAHQLAWFVVKGELPSEDIDHKNGKPGDDWIENLRLCSDSQNMQNQRIGKNNRSGFKGVFWRESRGHWVARLAVNKRKVYAGSAATAEDAARLYDAKALELYGEFARLNFPLECGA